MLEALGKLEEANKLRDALAAVVADKKGSRPEVLFFDQSFQPQFA